MKGKRENFCWIIKRIKTNQAKFDKTKGNEWNHTIQNETKMDKNMLIKDKRLIGNIFNSWLLYL